MRLVRGADGSVQLDATRRAPGRGAYLHPDRACIDLARRRRALERALRCPVPDGVWTELARS